MDEIKIISNSENKALSLLLWNLEKEIFGNECWTLQNLEDHLLHSGCIVYSSNEKSIGYLIYLNGMDEIELLRIGVLADFRRKGIAELLIESLISMKKEIYLEVRVDNKSAISLYEKKGFSNVGKRKKYYNDGTDGLIFLLKI